MAKTKAAPIEQKPTPAASAFTELLLKAFKLNGLLLATGDRLVRHLGMTSARWQVMGAIDVAQVPLTVAQIARNMGLQRQSVQRLANILSVETLVRFVENPHHKRAKLVELTERGHAILKKVKRVQVTWANQISSGIRERDLKQTEAVLQELNRRLTER